MIETDVPVVRHATISDTSGSPTTGEPLLAVEGLSARYRTEHEAIEAVRNVSLEVRAGETLALPEIQQWMADAEVAKPKWPERIEFVDDLPMTPSGKVQKFRLREMIAERIAAERPADSAAGGSGG